VHTAEIVLGLLVLASVVASFADRLSLPAPSLLVLAGLGVGLIPGVPTVHVTPEIVSLVVLPPLLYAAAVDVVIADLRAVLRPVAALAVGLVGASAVVVAVVIHLFVPDISIQLGLVLGAALASTDPVAVSALARRLHLPPRLLALVQGESLLNDATSLLLFRVVVSGVVAGHFAAPGHVVLQFLGLGFGGAAIGLGCAFVVSHLHRRTDDTVIEAVISLLTPYAIFVVAEVAHTSGVTAVVFGGLYLSRRRYEFSRGPARLQIGHIYDVAVFLLEGAVFAIIGLQLPDLVRELPAAEHDFVLVSLAITGALLAARVVWVAGATFLPGLSEASADPRGRQRSRVIAVTSWAGTRGVIPLAAALSIPLTVDSGAAFPHRELLVVLATTCTAITLVVQGLTLRPVVRRAGLVSDPRVRTHEEAIARHAALEAAEARLDELQNVAAASPEAVAWLRRELQQRTQLAGAAGEEVHALRRELIGAESERLRQLVDAGEISEAVRRKVQRMLDLDEARSSDD